MYLSRGILPRPKPWTQRVWPVAIRKGARPPSSGNNASNTSTSEHRPLIGRVRIRLSAATAPSWAVTDSGIPVSITGAKGVARPIIPERPCSTTER